MYFEIESKSNAKIPTRSTPHTHMLQAQTYALCIREVYDYILLSFAITTLFVYKSV